jgi:hypothetical protein
LQPAEAPPTTGIVAVTMPRKAGHVDDQTHQPRKPLTLSTSRTSRDVAARRLMNCAANWRPSSIGGRR